MVLAAIDPAGSGNIRESLVRAVDRSQDFGLGRSVRETLPVWHTISGSDGHSCDGGVGAVGHGFVSGMLGFPEPARAAGQGDFVFAHEGVAVANRDHANVCGRSRALIGQRSLDLCPWVKRADERGSPLATFR